MWEEADQLQNLPLKDQEALITPFYFKLTVPSQKELAKHYDPY